MMNTLKRYWIFAYDNYYPEGGMNDFQTSCDPHEECLEWVKGPQTITHDYIEIFDTHTRQCQRDKWSMFDV